MSFADELKSIDLTKIRALTESFTDYDVKKVLSKKSYTVKDLPALISPAASGYIEEMAQHSKKNTLLRFGRIVKLYAPLYISNECINRCAYCGFNADNKLERKTLEKQEVLKEAEMLSLQGFRHILLVSGESPKHVPLEYLEEISLELQKMFSAVSIEVYPLDEPAYRRLLKSGVTGIAIYQETYSKEMYKKFHSGPKADFDFRLITPENAGKAGFREIGIGALMGLNDFRTEVVCIGLHAEYLMKNFWKAQIAISFPRIRASAGNFVPDSVVSDSNLAQAMFALRMVLPDADLVLSTRENPRFRDAMAGIAITRMSAGSKTNPGGYCFDEGSLKQFEIADERSPEEIARMLCNKGLEPVWKDFDTAFISCAGSVNGGQNSA